MAGIELNEEGSLFALPTVHLRGEKGDSVAFGRHAAEDPSRRYVGGFGIHCGLWSRMDSRDTRNNGAAYPRVRACMRHNSRKGETDQGESAWSDFSGAWRHGRNSPDNNRLLFLNGNDGGITIRLASSRPRRAAMETPGRTVIGTFAREN